MAVAVASGLGHQKKKTTNIRANEMRNVNEYYKLYTINY